MKTNSGAKKRFDFRIRKDQKKACFQKSHPDEENEKTKTESHLLGTDLEGRWSQRKTAAG